MNNKTIIEFGSQYKTIIEFGSQYKTIIENRIQ